MTRTDFIRLMGTGALGLVALNQLGCGKTDTNPNKDFTIDISTSQYSALQSLGGYVYANGVIIFRGTDGLFYALSQYCTHQGCTVEYLSGQNEIFCACHGSQFNDQGTVLVGPATSPLFQYSTSLSGTMLHVFTP